ncbi:MAG: helix-turn-helix domain-containing protein [Terracidiphilus sp.]
MVPTQTEEKRSRKPRKRRVPEPLIDSDKAAEMIGVAPKTLQKYARYGLVRGVHVGKFWRFRASLIDEWISREFENGSPTEANGWRRPPASTTLNAGQSCSPTRGDEHEASTASTRKSAA